MLTVQSTYITQQSPTINLAVTSEGEFFFLLNQVHSIDYYLGVNIPFPELRYAAMAPHSSTLAWKIPWREEPGRLQSMGSLESDTTERLHFHFSLSCIGEGNGNPLQCSCLENPRERKPGGLLSMGSHGVGHCRSRHIAY